LKYWDIAQPDKQEPDNNDRSKRLCNGGPFTGQIYACTFGIYGMAWLDSGIIFHLMGYGLMAITSNDVLTASTSIDVLPPHSRSPILQLDKFLLSTSRYTADHLHLQAAVMPYKP